MNRPSFRVRDVVTFLLFSLFVPLSMEAQSFTPELSSTTIGVVSGNGVKQPFQAAINHDPGFASSIQVKFNPATIPAGLTFTPSAQFLEPPYNPITFHAEAAAGTAPGMHPIEVIFSSAQTKTITLNVYVTDGASQPDFSISAVPPAAPLAPGATGQFSVTVTPKNAFTQQVTLSIPNHPNLTFTSGASTVNPGTTTQFTFTVLPGTPAGMLNVTVYGNSPSFPRKEISVPIQVAPAAVADFSISTTAPNPASVAQGGTTRFSVSATGLNGFSNPITVMTNPSAGVTATPASFTMNAGETREVTLTTSATAPVGTALVGVQAASGTLQKSNSVSFGITAAATPDFTIAVTAPQPAEIKANETSTVTVRATPTGGFNAAIQVSLTAAGPISAEPASFTLAPGQYERQVTLRANPNASQGAVVVNVAASSGTLQRSATAMLTLLPSPAGNAPVIDAVTPGVPIPSPAQSVFLVGRNFAQGATVTSLSPLVAIDPQVVFHNANLVEVRVTVRAGATPGAHMIQLRNPNGLSTVTPGRLIARSRDDIGAPLGVTTAAIVHPVDGTIVTNSESVFPQAVLATSGTGTITGHWEICNPFGNGVCLRFADFTATVAGGLPTRIKSETKIPAQPWSGAKAGQLRLVVDNPQSVEPAVARVIFASDRSSGFTIYAPGNGTDVSAASPRFSWTIAPGATGYFVEFESGEGRDVRSLRFRTTETWWTPSRQDLDRIGTGTHRWRVRPILAPGDTVGEPTPWVTITIRATALAYARKVADVASVAPAQSLTLSAQSPGSSGGGASAAANNYSVSPNLTITGGKDEDVSARAQFSGQGERTSDAAATKFTGDLSYGANLDPRRVVQESHNWLIHAGSAPERNGGDLRFGFTSPDFTDSAEYLTSGVARVGVIARAKSRFGTLSYYQPLDTAIHGVMSGNDENLEIRSAAFATPEGRRVQLRFIGLEVEEPENADFGTPASRLRTFGMLAKWDLSTRVALVAEVAQGKVEATEGFERASRDGTAFRIGLSGNAAGFMYGVNLRSTGANFVNPSNRGLTAGGVSDRIIGDMNLSRSFGRTSVSLGVRRQEQGHSDESTMPDANQTGFNVSVNSMLGRVMLSLGANTTSDRGDADLVSFLPEVRRDQRGFSATLSETVGRFSLSQTLNLQQMRDDINSLADQDTTSLTFSASGPVVTNVTLSANLSATRTDADPMLGTTDNWNLSLQPSFALPFASLSFQPVISLSRSMNDVMSTDSRNRSLQAQLQWSPNWLGSFAAAQISAGWNRSAMGAMPAMTGRTYQGSLTMRLNKNKGMPLFPPATPLPGTEMPNAPEPGSSNPVEGTPLPTEPAAEPVTTPSAS